MGLAVHQGDLDVDHRVAAEHALGQLVARSLLHRRDELPRYGPADHLLGELDPGAAVQRLDVDSAHRVLAVSTRLLHQPALHGGRADERLAQRGSQLLDLHGHVPGVPQGAEQLVHVGRTHRPQHDLVGFGVVLQPHGHVLGDQALQRGRELLLVGPRDWRGSRPAAAARAAARARPAPGLVLRRQACPRSRLPRAWRPTPDHRRSRTASVGSPPAIGADRGPTRSSSLSWSGWPSTVRPAKRVRWPETCSGVSARSVPENTRTRQSRPTNGVLVVRTTSATRGPSGSQRQVAERLAVRGVDRRQRRGRR